MSLADRLKRQIALDGPMGIDAYMAACLLDPKDGYYTNREAFGAGGDFVTAPEISQMFGELIGLCLAQCWMDQGRPGRFVLAELGPGRGTLMADLLRAVRGVPGFLDAASIVLLEASPALQHKQAEALSGHTPNWISRVQDLPDAPLYLIANEFLDALPVRQFQRDGALWRERQVGLSESELAFGLGPPQPQPALTDRLDDTTDGDLVEYCPGLAPVIDTVSGRVSDHGGAALFVDYGDWHTLGDTLQAVRGHAPVDPLATPGAADLTAHVDFEAISRACRSAHTRVTPQGVFLERLGITTRAEALAQGLSGTALSSHIAAHRRLTHPDEMGNLFKVIGLYPASETPPPGLEP